MSSSIQQEENKEKVHLFFGKYRILKRIGCGSFGNVYKGINIIDKKNVAIKVEKKDEGYNLLQKESYYLYNLKGIGVPELISYGYSGKYNVLIQTLLGESLGKIFFKNSNRFSLKDICMFTIQILHRIEFVHSKYLIHRDIKPENFLIGSPDEYMIYIIDFGLSKKYKSSRTNKHIQFKLTKKFTGTARYASINAVRGAEQSRRDDLEAIGYMLMYFFNGGKLPWQGVSCKEKAQKYAKIYYMKKNLNYQEFCKNMPKEIITYMMYCRDLQFEKEPNYEYLRNLFENVLEKNCFQNDLKFSWIKDYSILNNLEEIKLKIFPNNNMSKRKQSPQVRIYKQLESAREYNKDKENNNNQESINNNNNYKLLISNNSQNNLLQKNNPIIKAKTFSSKYNIGHKRFNSSWDANALLKRKESDMLKSSLAKYNSSIDDEEGLNNIRNNNNSNLNLSNNGQLGLIRDNSKNNLFYFSNFNDLSKSFASKNNNNNNNENTNMTNNSNMIKKTFTSFINNDNNNINNTNDNVINNKKISNKNIINKQNKNNNHSPNIVKSFSYVKKYKNKIDEIKINFQKDKKSPKNTRNINDANQLTNNESNINKKTKNKSLNIIYSKKSTTNRKNIDGKKPNIKNNNIINNPILVNKSKNLENYKIKLKKYGSNIPKNKIMKLVKPKLQNINIQISPVNINSRSFTNLLKKTSNNNTHQTQDYIVQNPTQRKISKPNMKKENLKTHNLSTNINNNAEGKINKIKTMIIHNSNMKKENKAHNKKINTDLFFTENNNDFININQKRINKYKNMRHKMGVKSNNLTLTQNDNNNYVKTIPKYRPINKTINSTINNNNNTITNTINSNNNNNTIISIYNNYNINNNNKNNSTNEIYKSQNGINLNLNTLNNTNKNKPNNNSIYFSYNGYKVNSYQNYINLNTRKSPLMVNKQKINKIVTLPAMLPKLNYDGNKNSNLFNSQIINNPNEFSYQDDEPKDNLRNYFSINGNMSINDHKKNIPLNLSSVRLNLNSLKIKKILSDLKYYEPIDNTMKKTKKKFANSNSNIFENQKNKKIINKIEHNSNNNINRTNSYQCGKKINYKNIMNNNNNHKKNFEYFYPTINRKKTDIFYQKLPEFKMNFDIDDSYLAQENRNNTPSFRRHEHNREYFNKYLKENNFMSLKL